MTVERKRGFLRPGQDLDQKDAQKWGLPDYAEKNRKAKPSAFNYDPSWMPSFEEPEEAEPEVLTEEQLELIRQEAYQQGLHQGQEAGFKQGYEKGKEEGYQAGFEQGQQEGNQQGMTDAQQVIEQHIAVFTQLADQFAQPLNLMNSQVEKQLVDMVLALAKEVIHVELEMNPQIILDTVKASVESLPIAGHTITIKLNPEDSEMVRQSYGEEGLAARQWTLVAEPSLERGDVQIEAGESSVHYRMDERVKTVLHNFCGANRHTKGE
ncbi:flagellar assembly protein FliH [Vibrio viridaestus]|uniref:Flagellar assembly protein FliH n=1 Tax=Vibrio viridaestus TaxID=2487322 RepID=A0A3N9TJI6_9VIBR|nr:flagellar assembly protein FliH [Vibrio viridaestus]RQW64104.1 flagellar assembly protein FliH [Vibrio viridaestus]